MPEPSLPEKNPWPWPLIAVAGWLLPGLGHWLIGEKARGVIVGVTLLALFVAGLLVGGVDVVNHRDDPLWFAGELLIGPITPAFDVLHTALDESLHRQIEDHAQQHQGSSHELWSYNRSELDLLTDPDGRPVYRKSLGRVKELGTLYCTLAGVLNLLVILDAIGRHTAPPAPTSDAARGKLVTREGGAE